jgi:hypothetical protein
MQHHNRANKKWNINEVIRLQREYELLELPVNEIATRHERSVKGIVCKLKSEGFIESLEDARGFFNDMPPLISIAVPAVEQQKREALRMTSVDVALDVRLSALEMSIERINASLSLMALSNQNLKIY